MKTTFTLAAFYIGALLLPAAALPAATLLSLDFGSTQSPVVESGFTGYSVTNVGVAGPMTQTFGSFTVTLTNGKTVDGSGNLNATGLVNARDRGALTDSGAFTYNDLYRDFVTQGADTGLQLGGLTANTAYQITFYAYDNNNTRSETFKNITGATTSSPNGANLSLGTISWTAASSLTSNNLFSIVATATSDSSGRLTFDINSASATTVLNGLILASIPEPSGCAALLAGAALAYVAARRRRQ